MNERVLIERIYQHVEDGAVDKAVFTCVRLARNVGDVFNLLIFLRELSVDQSQFKLTFVDETRGLKSEARQSLWTTSLEHWLEGRTLDGYSAGEERGEKRNVLAPGVGELLRELEHFENAIRDLDIPKGMGEYDTAAFTDLYLQSKGAFRRRIHANQTVIERIRTRCLNYASRIEKQLAAQAGNVDFLTEVQASVNNFFAARSEQTYNKLIKAAELVNVTTPEDSALLLTSVRRAIKAVADFFYPPCDEEVLCHDGKRRRMGDDQYLNRLEEFCLPIFTSSTSDAMLKEELFHLSAFAKRLNAIASKGVHAEVSPEEGKQGLIGLYMFLSNVITRIERQPSSKESGTTC